MFITDVATQTQIEVNSMSCQTELSGNDLAQLKQQLQTTQNEVKKIQCTAKQLLTCEALKKDNQLLKFYTCTGMIQCYPIQSCIGINLPSSISLYKNS